MRKNGTRHAMLRRGCKALIFNRWLWKRGWSLKRKDNIVYTLKFLLSLRPTTAVLR